MNKEAKILKKWPKNMVAIYEVEKARRAAGFRTGYGQYVAAGCPGMEKKALALTSAPKKGTKKCPVCGKWFKPKRKNQKYCCMACAGEHLGRKDMGRKRVVREIIIVPPEDSPPCPVCGKPILERKKFDGKPKMYCSQSCATKASHLNKKTKGRGSLKKCQMCGADFVDFYGNSKYCCEECRRAAKLENMRRFRQEERREREIERAANG